MGWRDAAACRGASTAEFFGGRGVRVRGRARCEVCVVAEVCLWWAIVVEDGAGYPLRRVGRAGPGAALEGRGRRRRGRSPRQFGGRLGGIEHRCRHPSGGPAVSRPCPPRRAVSAATCAGEQWLVLVAQVAADPMIGVAAARMLLLLVDELRDDGIVLHHVSVEVDGGADRVGVGERKGEG